MDIPEDFKWLLLVLDTSKGHFDVRAYSDRLQASRDLAEIERTGRTGTDIDAVLVWVPSAQDLRAAYPNYYADTKEFLKALDAALAGEF